MSKSLETAVTAMDNQQIDGLRRRRRLCIIVGVGVVAVVIVATILGIVLTLQQRTENSSNVTLYTGIVPRRNLVVDKLVSSKSKVLLEKRDLESNVALQSKTAFSYATVDGFRSTFLGVSFIRGSEADRENIQFTEGSYNNELGTPFEVDATNASVSSPIIQLRPIDGNFDGFSISLSGTFQLKAYCKTANYLMYTSSNGIQRIDINLNASSLPDDYGYINISQTRYGSTSGSTINPLFEYPVILNNPSTVRILFDLSYFATCYDGSLPALPVSPVPLEEGLMPFMAYSGTSQTVSTYAADEPVFGLEYAALFFCSGNISSNDALPTGETYLFSFSLENISNLNLTSENDVKLFGAWTIAFDREEQVIAIQSRGGTFQGENVFDYTKFHNITYLGNDTYSMYNGGYDLASGRYSLTRFFGNFTRIRGEDYTTILPVLFADGPDCIDSSNNNNFSQSSQGIVPCFGSKLLYFRKVKRNS